MYCGVECLIKSVTQCPLPVDDLIVLFCFCPPLYPILSFTALVCLHLHSTLHQYTFSFLFFSPPMYIFRVSGLLAQLYFQHISLLLPLNSAVTSTLHSSLFLHPSQLHHVFLSFSLYSFSTFYLLSEGTARAPAGLLAVVKAAQTVT